MKGISCDDCKVLIAEVRQLREEILQLIRGYKIQIEKSQNTDVLLQISDSLINCIELVCKSKVCASPGPDTADSGKKFRLRVDMDNRSNDSAQPQPVNLQPTPEEEVMSNCLVVKEILEFLPPEDQLRCRTTNKVWMTVATSELKKSWYKQLHFTFNSKSNEYKTQFGSLKQLTDLLENNKNFPINRFLFSRGHMRTPDVDKFFSSHGNIVRSLCLDLDDGMQTDDDDDIQTEDNYEAHTFFRKILLNVGPTLECLELHQLPFDPEDEMMQLFPDPHGTIQFPNLKKLITPHYVELPPGFYRDLLNAAINLESTDELVGSRIADLMATNKIHTVQKIHFYNGEILEDMESFCQLASSQQLRLTEIYLIQEQDITDTRISEAINNILESSWDSLENIWCLDRVAKIITRVPLMKNMRRLYFDFKPGFVPTDCPVLSQIFPNLTDVTLYRSATDPLLSVEEFTKLRQKVGALSSVKILKFSGDWTCKMIKILSSSFPGVTTLEIKLRDVNELPKVLRVIWAKFKMVETVKLNIMVDENRRDVCAETDSSITGIDVETCTQLYKHSRQVSLEEAKKWRTLPSIFDAKCLKVFQLSFYNHSGVVPVHPIFSHVSGIYGLQPVRKERGVKVTIQIGRGVRNTVVNVLPFVDSYN